MIHEGPLLLALLVLGHVLADFVFQSRAMVEGKLAGRVSAFVRHTVVVLALHAAVLLPVYPGRDNIAVVVGIAGAHLVIDIVKTALARTSPRPLTWFSFDQGLHVVVLVVAVTQVSTASCTFPADALGPVRVGAIVVTTLIFQAAGGSAIVSFVLSDLRSAGGEPLMDEGTRSVAGDTRGAGKRIGILERWLVTLAVAHGQWAAVGLVLTAKSIARFKELEDRAFSEVYLVGTMTSVFVAIVGGLLLAHLVPTFAT